MIEIDPNAEYPLTDLYFYVVERDSALCQECGGKGKECHHIVPRSLDGLDCTNNLILLCRKCHGIVQDLPDHYEEKYLNKVKKNEQRLRRNLIG